MIRVGIDQHGLQAWAERERGGRLTGPDGLFTVLEAAGFTCVMLDTLEADRLVGIDVIAMTTRVSPCTADEVRALGAAVRAGAGLWLCSNHGPFSFDAPENNLVRYDQAVANSFFVTLLTCVIEAREKDADGRRPLVELPLAGVLAAGNPAWPVVAWRTGSQVSTAMTSNGCGILPAVWQQVVAPFDDPSLRNRLDRADPPPGLAWAVTVEGPAVGAGRVVVCADSGWLGNVSSTFPGPGLFQRCDNAQLALNTVSWLGRVGER